jgi:hypothetical protein
MASAGSIDRVPWPKSCRRVALGEATPGQVHPIASPNSKFETLLPMSSKNHESTADVATFICPQVCLVLKSDWESSGGRHVSECRDSALTRSKAIGLQRLPRPRGAASQMEEKPPRQDQWDSFAS